ncbi:MAG TPA: molybdopterin-dependent oxidoreductase [Anaerolineae bacterium]|nr:molybdopterin-dependent oxidoreductase [Anaerolineae bacterium]
MKSVTRRQFLRVATVSTAGVLAAQALSACGSAPSEVQPVESAGPPGTVQPQILRNENLPGFNVRYYKPFPAPNPSEWQLSVEGMVKNPQSLPLGEVQRLPSVVDVRRMKCVECWSARAKWEGFDLDTLRELVDPEPEAHWLHFFCADGYYESLSLEELAQEGVQFAYGMNDELLPLKYGSPLRLVVPSKLGYKWPKAIVRLEFAAQEKAGYWPTVGPYTTSGAILPGKDHPLDLPDGLRSIEGGEVLYPEDLEARRALS